MTSMADAYDDGVGGVQTHRRLKAGVALLALGSLLGIAALIVALANPTAWGARRVAGVLAGLAAPAGMGGAVVILPANVRLRVAAAIGGSLTLLGVAGFWHAYPSHWMGHGQELTPYVTATYFLGMLTIAVCLFAGIATFKRRNDPGGTVSLEIGSPTTKVVEVREEVGGFGSIGFLGSQPEGEVDTQTNRPDGAAGAAGDGGTAVTGTAGTDESTSVGGAFTDDDAGGSGSDGRFGNGLGGNDGAFGSSTTDDRSTPGASASVSDGGTASQDVRSPDPGVDSSPSHDAADEYCGNCVHFQYVRTDDGMLPHCGLHGEYMEDMEACEQWRHNAER